MPGSYNLQPTTLTPEPRAKLKICVLGTRGFPNVQGGVETHCEHLYPLLAQKGCDVTVLTRKPYIDLALQSYKGVRLIPVSCPKQKFLEAIVHSFKGIFIAKKLKCDILHIHAIGPSVFALMARILGMEVVVTHHGPDYKREKWPLPAKVFLKFCEYVGVISARKVITISQNIADDIKVRFGRDAVVIPNGVTTVSGLDIIHKDENQVGSYEQRTTGYERRTEATLSKYRLEKGKYILSVGRFVPEKGFDDLIEAFSLLQAQWCKVKEEEVPPSIQPTPYSHIKAFKLVIVGDADHPDKYSRELKQKVEEMLEGEGCRAKGEQTIANNSIVLTGRLTGKPLEELYSNAGLFVLPSYYEGLPIVLLEALSYGLSCIASDIPANREVGLSEDRYFKPGDIQALAEKIREFIDKPLTEEERKRQINMIAERYDWEKIAERTLDVYEHG